MIYLGGYGLQKVTLKAYKFAQTRHLWVASATRWRDLSSFKEYRCFHLSTPETQPTIKTLTTPSSFSRNYRGSVHQTQPQHIQAMADPPKPAPQDGVAIVTDFMEKPSLDIRSYRVILLQNHLEALLINDPETDKASAALDVNVGSFSDPKDMPGLAHAVEHMLFMGTEKV
jgi:insulinase (Peptidase family M16)